MNAKPASTFAPARQPAAQAGRAGQSAAARRPRRALLWGALMLLLLVAQTLLLALTVNYESTRAQDDADAAAGQAATGIKHDLLRMLQALQTLAFSAPQPVTWRINAAELLRGHHELLRVERRFARAAPAASAAADEAVDSPFGEPLFRQMARRLLDVDTEVACAAATRMAAPAFSRTYFVPMAGGHGVEVLDLCIPVKNAGRDDGHVVGSFSLAALLDAAVATHASRPHELSFVEGDGTRLARAGIARGAGVYQAERLLDLPGAALQLRADGVSGRPSVIPNLATALVLGLSLALFGVVLLLARDVQRRARAEGALAEALAFRKAMEDSLITGLRARDLNGRITYANPAFCAMVGFSVDELQTAVPPYWPPEHVQTYGERQQGRLLGVGRAPHESREGYETVFMRKNGERFPVVLFEAPLVDGGGRHTGWMSAVLDVSAQRRVEDISRQQQDRLQATARLATVGEMASLLSHELNQPLSAIASYASGSLNMLDAANAPGAPDLHAANAADAANNDGQTLALLRQALERIAEQAERAGRIIKSVHHFVRRRDGQRETIATDVLLDAVLPLVRLQARKSGTRIDIDLPAAPEKPPRVVCDRTMLEQVLLNLTRNGIQSMEDETPLADRVLRLRVRQTHPAWVTFTVADAGPGIAPDVAAQLFTPFYTTRSEGMGLGLSLCRTVIEQHGGVLDFGTGAHRRGSEFRFTLPSPPAVESGETSAPP